ncbi:hypothetical protein PROFUN_07003 [Planoprotostelium fungivorum]|uniref:A to I editase domain-containing protein n=1 Tax=Planoprotostelium fungivorum TaxID=1890364 RepID=A0A2P6NMN6_9EUKA|nr:hypothetical protein PROFUN_07003 [Planoprotostelium fungivorum]
MVEAEEMSQRSMDKMAEMTIQLYERLAPKGKPTAREWTVLASFCLLQKIEENWTPVKILSMGTGNRCLSESQLNKRGDIIHDSHAEIIARRSLIRLLYDELRKEGSKAIFEKKDDKYNLKDIYRLGMYISHTPCGDASIFEGPSVEVTLEETEEPEKKKRRVSTDDSTQETTQKRMRGDEPQNWRETGLVRRKPGRGEFTTSMSCSDKIASWSVLGVQGAILSTVMSPLYLSYLVVGDYYHREALDRAINLRVRVEGLPEGYSRRHIRLGHPVVVFQKGKSAATTDAVSSGYAISYMDGGISEVTVAQSGRKMGLTKKNLDSPKHAPSLSKMKLGLMARQAFGCKGETYIEMKRGGVDYRRAKEVLLSSSEFREWNRLPSEHSDFQIKPI